jgi:TonB-linked SusC/RagA family outer membrane protein
MIGYETKEVVYGEGGVLNVRLREVKSDLDEVQVVAYGQIQKKFLTSNIGSVSGEQIARQPVTNPLLALQGRVPGLFIQQSSGQTAGAVSVTIQGKNSMRIEGNAPFYVVDGIPYSPEFTSQTLMGGNITTGGGSAFNFISPSDIESVEILKDADATAIYGSRAANGAILITTKRGKAGETRVGLDVESGRGKVTRMMDVMNTDQYLEMRREAYKNDNVLVPTSATSPSLSNYDLTIWDPNKNHNWQKELIGGTAGFTRAQANVSGGTNLTQFIAGAGYNRQTTVYPNDLADVKYNAHININHASETRKFNFMVNASYMQDLNEMNFDDLTNIAITLAPNAPDLYNADGTLNWGPYPNNPNLYSFNNPLVASMIQYRSTTDNLLSNMAISYEIIPGLTIKSTAGYNILDGDEKRLTTIEATRPDALIKEGSSEFLNRSIKSYIVEPQLTFNRNFESSALDFLLGTTFQESKTNTVGYNAYGFKNNAQLDNIGAATSVVGDAGRTTQALYKYTAIFSRINYRYKDRYILNLTARRDGSSRFGSDNKFHSFYSVGGAWLFGDEQFFKNTMPFISFGKLRANYGTTGNDQISDYAYASLLENLPVGMPYQGIVGVRPYQLTNPALQWEETRKLNIGIDLGLFKNRIMANVNYFRNRSSNQLLSYQLPSTAGFDQIVTNFPATLQNSGFEFLLDLDPIKSEQLTWHISGNATIPRNKLVKFPNFENSTYSQTFIIGEPANVIRRFQFAGVDPETGLYIFNTGAGGTTNFPSFSTDILSSINPNPKWYGGFTNTITYKKFTFEVLFQYVNQVGGIYKFQRNGFGQSNTNGPVEVSTDRWRNKGDVAIFSKVSTFFSLPTLYGGLSNGAYGDASFLRLKNASISYTLPASLLTKVGIKNAKVYALGQNLLTFTGYKGLDPENNGALKLPPLRMYTLGIQVSL